MLSAVSVVFVFVDFLKMYSTLSISPSVSLYHVACFLTHLCLSVGGFLSAGMSTYVCFSHLCLINILYIIYYMYITNVSIRIGCLCIYIIYTYVYVCIRYIHIMYIYIYIYIHIYVFIFVNTYICIYIHRYIYICIYIHRSMMASFSSCYFCIFFLSLFIV